MVGVDGPRPRAGMAIELGRGDAGDIGDVVVIGEGLASEGFAAKDAPPAFDQVEPRGADGNEGVLDTRMRGQPVADRATAVAGEVVRDQVEITVRIGLVEGLEQGEIAGGVARGAVWVNAAHPAHRGRTARHRPRLYPAALIVQGHFDAVAIHGPARSGWEVARGYGPEFVDAEDRRRRRVAPCRARRSGPFWDEVGIFARRPESGPPPAHPSWRKMRRT